MKKWLNKLFKSESMTTEERWLSQSVDLVDLENRQKMIARGQAPWQHYSNNFVGKW